MNTDGPSVVAVVLLCGGSLTITAAFADEPSAPSGKSTAAQIQRRLEDGARTYSHFATGGIVGNRRTSPDRCVLLPLELECVAVWVSIDPSGGTFHE